jgi:hypothetical protein
MAVAAVFAMFWPQEEAENPPEAGHSGNKFGKNGDGGETPGKKPGLRQAGAGSEPSFPLLKRFFIHSSRRAMRGAALVLLTGFWPPGGPLRAVTLFWDITAGDGAAITCGAGT